MYRVILLHYFMLPRSEAIDCDRSSYWRSGWWMSSPSVVHCEDLLHHFQRLPLGRVHHPRTMYTVSLLVFPPSRGCSYL